MTTDYRVTVINTPLRMFDSCIYKTQAEIFGTNSDTYCFRVLIPKTATDLINQIKLAEKDACEMARKNKGYKGAPITSIMRDAVDSDGVPYEDERKDHLTLKVLDPANRSHLHRVVNGVHPHVMGADGKPMLSLDGIYDGCYVKFAIQIVAVKASEWRLCGYLRAVMFSKAGERIEHGSYDSTNYFSGSTDGSQDMVI